MDQFATYSKFYQAADAEFLISLLERNQIPYKTSKEINQLDNVYIGDTLDPMFELKIERGKFQLVNSLLAKKATEDFPTLDDSYYLLSLDQNELRDILRDADSWNAYDVQIAKLILAQKGEHVDHSIKTEIDIAYAPEKIKTDWLVVSYILSLFAIVGIFVGGSIANSKKTLSDGKSVHVYDASSRKHGKIIIAIGLISTILVVARIMA